MANRKKKGTGATQDQSAEEKQLQDLIGLGKFSARKSYYPELQKKIEELKDERNKYERIFSDALCGIFQAEPHGGIIVANPAMSKLCGYTSNDHLLSISDIGKQLFADPDEKNRLIKILIDDKSVIGFETRFKRHDGTIIDVSLNASIQTTPAGEYLECFVQNITEHKQAEVALRKSEERFRLLATNLPSVMIYQVITKHDGSRQFSYVSDNIRSINKVTPDAVLADPNVIYSQVLPEQLPDLIEKESSAIQTMIPFEYEAQLRLPDGEIRWFQFMSTPHSLPDGSVAWDGVEIDITDRKKNEDYPKNLNRLNKLIIGSDEAEQMFRNVTNALLEIYDCDRAWVIYTYDPTSEHYEILINQTKPEWFIPECVGVPVDSEISTAINSILNSDKPLSFYSTQNPLLPRETIEKFNVKSLLAVTISPKVGNKWILGLHQCSFEREWTDDDKQLLLEIANRITDTLNILLFSRELQKAKNYISNIIDSMPSVLVGVDIDGMVTQWNKTAEQYTGIAAGTAQGKKLSDVFPQIASEMKKIIESIRNRETKQEQKRLHHPESGTCCEDIIIYPLIANGIEGAVIRIDDVTDKVRMEEMMIQSEKMLSVGGLAAGMAHEVNNPIAGIMQTAGVMANRLGERVDMPANLKAAEAAGTTMEAIKRFMEARGIPGMIATINESGRRVAAIVDNMLSFARKSDAMVSSHDLEDLIDKTLELAATDYDLKKHFDFKLIEIRREYEAGLPFVPCEGAKIQQVLLNILRNGAQAMQEAGTESPLFILRTRFEKDRKIAVIEIEDNGPGMTEATRKRVFEPFYTTKPVGVGTGLGLSVSYFIITENHGGEMAVESAPGSGAKFIIRLPLKWRKV